ncbi:MAG: EamA family transporter [Cypionkella sp.]
MTLTVFLALLAAAVMHASWNALIKVRTDRFASITITSLGMGLIAAPVLPFVQIPPAAAWPWIVASVTFHIGYRLFLVRAYDAGDLAQTYPLARGAAPLLTAIGAVLLNNEVPSSIAILGIILLSCGTVLMSLRGGLQGAKINHRAVIYALLTAVLISSYTLSDGNGARAAQTAASYAAWLFVCDATVATLIGFAARGRSLLPAIAHEWKAGLLTGGLSAGSYGIAMWAMTKAPIASVAALRETSILFAMLISVLFLGETSTRSRIVSAVFIVAGAMALRFG